MHGSVRNSGNRIDFDEESWIGECGDIGHCDRRRIGAHSPDALESLERRRQRMSLYNEDVPFHDILETGAASRERRRKVIQRSFHLRGQVIATQDLS